MRLGIFKTSSILEKLIRVFLPNRTGFTFTIGSATPFFYFDGAPWGRGPQGTMCVQNAIGVTLNKKTLFSKQPLDYFGILCYTLSKASWRHLSILMQYIILYPACPFVKGVLASFSACGRVFYFFAGKTEKPGSQCGFQAFFCLLGRQAPQPFSPWPGQAQGPSSQIISKV